MAPPPKARKIKSGDSDLGEGDEVVKKPDKPDIPLFMECVDEDPEPAQQEFYDKQNQEFKDAMKKLEDLCKAGAKINSSTDNSVTFRLTESTTSLGPTISQSTANTATGQQSVVAAAAASGQPPGSYRLLMDPKTGRIIGSIPTASIPTTLSGPVQPSPGVVRAPTVTPIASRTPTPRSRMLTPGSGIRQPIRPSLNRTTPTPPARGHTPPARSVTPVKSPQIVDLTKPGPEPVGAPPIRRAFPALSVQAKPQRTVPGASAKRSELDGKVKGLLVHTPAKFTEWLIQQGLVRSEQYDNTSMGRIKLKLGMYSDGKKFPHSGGYVWIQEGAANKYTSVYKGSIFEISNYTPTVILKLIYHWACQTNLPNVAQWVKVDNTQIDNFYTNLRCVCVAAVQDEINHLGGNGRTVEIGVISLGTTTADGQKREVRVEVLGVLDRTTKNIRLRATEPIQGASQSDRFSKIFEPLPIWINPNSKIVTDYSVDRETLSRMGFKNVAQCTLNAAQTQRSDTTNQQIMDYLKKVVPKMFQNTLSNLTSPVIQQFLDELTFRELFGQYSLACFDSMIQKITAQTTATALKDDSMVRRLTRIAANPFADDWRYSAQQIEAAAVATSARASPSPGNRYGIDSLPPSLRTVDTAPTKRASSAEPEENIDAMMAKKIKVAKELVQLENYFYATLPGDVEVLNSEFKADMAFKCHICKKLFMNNIEFMKHLHLHVESDRATAIDFADLTQCKYCNKDFETPFKMQEHYEDLHLRKGSEFVCRICDEPFKMKTHLIHHMTKCHIRAEMPYLCNICGFRSSMHRDCIDHFHEAHDRTDKLQCPLCLKTYSLYNEKGYTSATAITFMQHLQKHEDSKNKKNVCKKCALNFHNEGALKNHVEKDHVSFRGFDELELYQYAASDEPIMMPKPDEKQIRMAVKKSVLIPRPPQQSAFAAQNLEDMVMYDVSSDKCCECDRSMTVAGHYTAYLCCTKCRYSSCCARAMSTHVQLFHTKSIPEFILGKPVLLEKPMYCCCGFESTSGNKLAKHLASNRCKSAYATKEESQNARIETDKSAGFAPLVSLEEEEKMAQGIDPRISISQTFGNKNDASDKDGKKEKQEEGPLAFLGLQRKESVDDEEKKAEKNDEVEKEGGEDMEVDDGEEREGGDETEKGGETEETQNEKESDVEKEEEKDEVGRDNDGMEEIVEHPEKEEEKPSGPPGTILFGTLAMYMGERRPSQTQEDEKEEAGGENVEDKMEMTGGKEKEVLNNEVVAEEKEEKNDDKVASEEIEEGSGNSDSTNKEENTDKMEQEEDNEKKEEGKSEKEVETDETNEPERGDEPTMEGNQEKEDGLEKEEEPGDQMETD